VAASVAAPVRKAQGGHVNAIAVVTITTLYGATLGTSVVRATASRGDGGRPAPAAGARPPAAAPRVFVSYTHDDEDHRDSVRRFATFLMVTCGFDVRLDQWELDRRRNWYHWAIEQITKADFVLIVASPLCRRVADGDIPNSANRGMQSEMSIIMDRLHYDRAAWLPKLLPVVLPGRSTGEIPLFLQPGIADFYQIQDFSVAGAAELLRAIMGVPLCRRPRRNPTVIRLP
jgi:hypothetical protein